MKLQVADTITNDHTNNTFTIIGIDDDVALGLRVWVEPSPTHIAHTHIGFRFRWVMADQPSNKFVDCGLFISNKYPGITWSGISKEHVSLAGIVNITTPIVAPDVLKEIIIKNNLTDQLSTLINKIMGGGSYDYSGPILTLVTAAIDASWGENKSKGAATDGAIIIDFPGVFTTECKANTDTNTDTDILG